jgi:hypothetical protein
VLPLTLKPKEGKKNFGLKDVTAEHIDTEDRYLITQIVLIITPT